MHVMILTSTADAAERMRLGTKNSADRYTVIDKWSDVASFLETDRPNLILIERDALAQVELSAVTQLLAPGRWPPILIVDALAADSQQGIALARRLTHPSPQQYEIGELHIDTRKRRAGLGQRWVTLPPIQYRLLLALAEREGEVVACRELLRIVWGYKAEENEARELVKVHIRQIRRRLGLEPEKHHYIRSIRGFGYMLTTPEEE